MDEATGFISRHQLRVQSLFNPPFDPPQPVRGSIASVADENAARAVGSEEEAVGSGAETVGNEEKGDGMEEPEEGEPDEPGTQP